jgi:NADPH:quinone reductase-like Zn-dependent oxidoreductase
MKAIVQRRFGSPESLKIMDIEQPIPKGSEILVRVQAASLNAADLEILRGTWTGRIIGPFKPRHRIPGSDVAGTVQDIGKDVKRYQVGDEVFGDLFMSGFGAFAEYVCVPEDVLAPKPSSMTFEEASTYPQSAIIALQSLRGKREIKPGQKVLINGACGGMGTFAVQIAKYYGAEVTGVDSGEKLEMVRSIGADHVIDYRKEDFTRLGNQYDMIVDVVAHHSIFAYKRALSSDGIFIVVGGSLSSIIQTVSIGTLISAFGGKNMGINPWNENDEDDLKFLAELFEAGKVVPIIDRVYPLSKVPEAYRNLEDGHTKGKIVITME